MKRNFTLAYNLPTIIGNYLNELFITYDTDIISLGKQEFIVDSILGHDV